MALDHKNDPQDQFLREMEIDSRVASGDEDEPVLEKPVNIYTDDTQAAQRMRLNLAASGALGMIEGHAPAQYASNPQSEEKKRREEDLARLRMQYQLASLRNQMRILQDLLDEYARRMAELGEEIERETGMADAIKGYLHDYADKGYAQFLIDTYGSRPPHEAMDALMNPLRDEQGNLVYSSREGLYRLQTDAEGKVVTNPQTGKPVRIYYSDEEAAPLIEQAVNRQNPRMFAEYTPFSQDPENVRMAEWVSIPPEWLNNPNAGPTASSYGAQTLLNSSGNAGLSVKHMPDDSGLNPDGFSEVCSKALCVLEENISEHEFELAETKEKYDEASEEYAALQEQEETLLAQSEGRLEIPAPAFDESQLAIDAHKNEIADIIATQDGVMDEATLGSIARSYGIFHITQLVQSLLEIEPSFQITSEPSQQTMTITDGNRMPHQTLDPDSDRTGTSFANEVGGSGIAADSITSSFNTASGVYGPPPAPEMPTPDEQFVYGPPVAPGMGM